MGSSDEASMNSGAMAPLGEALRTVPCPSDRLETYRELTLREYDLLIERSNMFLVYHSILMAGFALGSSVPKVIVILPFFGFAASIMWLIIGHRTLQVANHLHDKVVALEAARPPDDQVYSNFRSWRRKENPPSFGVRISSYFAIGFPLLWAITWILAYTLSR
jgi:hypothetical protein